MSNKEQLQEAMIRMMLEQDTNKDEGKTYKTESNESQFKFSFTDHDLYGSIANTDAIDTLGELSDYFKGYASYLNSHKAEEQVLNSEIDLYSEVSNEINAIKNKLIKYWESEDGVIGENKKMKDESLDPNIAMAPSTSLDLGDGASLGMLPGMQK